MQNQTPLSGTMGAPLFSDSLIEANWPTRLICLDVNLLVEEVSGVSVDLCHGERKWKGNIQRHKMGPIAYLLDRNEMSKFRVVFFSTVANSERYCARKRRQCKQKVQKPYCFLPDKAKKLSNAVTIWYSFIVILLRSMTWWYIFCPI